MTEVEELKAKIEQLQYQASLALTWLVAVDPLNAPRSIVNERVRLAIRVLRGK